MIMGKRNAHVVLSSEDEDNATLRSSSSNSSYTKSKSKSTSTSSRGKKRARLSSSRPRLSKDSSKLHEISLLRDDFNEVFAGFKCSPGTEKSNAEELWIDKYKPHSLEELAVQKKKVEEVKIWFEERLKRSQGVYKNNVLVISGQAGVGKSAAIHVIASHLGAVLCEWNTPTPVIWQEHLYNSGTGVKFTSKLEEFETFIERIRKYGLMPTSIIGESKASIILLIDDLPLTNGKAAFGRLKDCLHLFARSTLIPTAILVTDYGNADSADYTTRCWEELKFSLESAGACKIVFNPITTNSIRKVLFRICQLEQCDLTAEHVDLLAKASGGDIRHAITSLQFFSLKQNKMHSLSLSSLSPSVSKKRKSEPVILDDAYSLYFSRDETLSLFHALGKLLHNKRETGAAIENDKDAVLIQERLTRLPLKMDVPEKILCQAHAQPCPIADFLHENVLDFLNEEAIEDAWTLSSYLGDADILLAKLRGMVSRYDEADSVLQSAAGSVAVRGVLFGNSHPLSSRWHAIRRPKLWEVERTSIQNKNEMFRQRIADCKGFSSSNLSVIVTEYMPTFKLLGNKASGCFKSPQVSVQNLGMKDVDSFDKMSLEDQASGTSDDDDDIEDW
ncbi:hypothetical protein L6164_020185 [Bauhinia variegata]|uniref:Uncharacterized protein n=1 Tax=Bauhinia variegata TaxID=167791 RepID=A0ACB9MVM1_BAUVA|nr:hypothetical protein L6164_020185 [Bauhinia variegata]